MPSFIWSQSLTANQSGANPLTGWQYEYVPWTAIVRVYQRATTVNVRSTLFSGSQTIAQRSPVQAGGTAGSTPSPLNTPAIEFVATAGDRLILQNDEVGGAAATVDGIIHLDPV